MSEFDSIEPTVICRSEAIQTLVEKCGDDVARLDWLNDATLQLRFRRKMNKLDGQSGFKVVIVSDEEFNLMELGERELESAS